jgi:hypothetical protein
MRDIIHIGYPRTATTWFQNNLFAKVQNYNFIPREAVINNLFHPLPEMYNKNWAEEIRVNTQPFLISEEMISGKIRAGSNNLFMLKVYLERIKESFENPVIVIFLRRQPDILYSFYNLYIKKGGTFSFSKFLRQDLDLQESLLFSKSFFCYDIPLQIISNSVGKENIKIYLYEDFASDTKGFVDRFCKELNIDIHGKEPNFGKINSGYTPFQQKIKKLSNRFTDQGIPFKQYFFNVPYAYRFLQNVQTSKSKIPPDFLKQTEVFMPDFIKSNRKVMQGYNLPQLKNFNYPL